MIDPDRLGLENGRKATDPLRDRKFQFGKKMRLVKAHPLCFLRFMVLFRFGKDGEEKFQIGPVRPRNGIA
jgi:hypothetical protein